MSDYYTGIYLNRVPTGFGIYTGLALINSGNYPVKYSISISETQLTGIENNDTINGVKPNKTIFISDTLENKYDDEDSIEKIVNQNESGIFFILHKPFSDYKTSPPNGKHTGHETATITIKTTSVLGTIDDDISVDVSGQRVFIQPTPPRIGKFYAVTDYKPDSAVNIQYNWEVINSESYLTGFRIETSLDQTFTTFETIDDFEIKKNIDPNDPLLGTYNSFSGKNFQITITDLDVDTNYFARISGLNINSSGSQTFVTGFTTYNPELDDTAFSGLTPSPGSNLKFQPQILNLNKISDRELDFDLLKFLKENNNNSADFTKYSGAIIKFFPNTDVQSQYFATSNTKGAINLISSEKENIIFSTNINNIFTMQLEFENVSLYGHGGEGGNVVNGVVVTPKNGGPIFNLDNFEFDKGGVIQKMNYFIYKDTDSVFMAGAGGGPAFIITDNNLQTRRDIIIKGAENKYLVDVDLALVKP